MKIYIETPRLILREWNEKDIVPFARMNSDARVMEFFLKPLTSEESRDMHDRILAEFSASGFGLYAVECKEGGAFIGTVGLHTITFDVDFAPGVEIMWRILPEVWGEGYATEAAEACLAYARDTLKLKEVYAFTSLPNLRSERVMQKIGMERVREFGHPLVSPDHRLYRHVLYQLQF